MSLTQVVEYTGELTFKTASDIVSRATGRELGQFIILGGINGPILNDYAEEVATKVLNMTCSYIVTALLHC